MLVFSSKNLKIDQFFSVLKKQKTEEAMLSLIEKEKMYIAINNRAISSKKRTFTHYRNRAKALLKDNKLLSFFLEIMKLNQDEQREFKKAKIDEIKRSESNLREIYDVDGILSVAVNLLHAQSVYDVILGVCLLTGRRTAEVGCTAEFEFISDRMLFFKGQLKTRKDESRSYEIPVLSYSASDVIDAMVSITTKRTSELTPAIFNAKASNELSLRVKKHFQRFVEGDITAKDLRAVYATTAYHELNNKRIDKASYFSRILGHSEDDLVTRASYSDFFIP